MADNLRHAQYRNDGSQVDDPQKIVELLPVSPSGGDDTQNILAGLRAGGGTVKLYPGVFFINTPVIAEYYGTVNFGTPRVEYIKCPKIIGSGMNGVTVIYSTVVGQATFQVDSTKVPAAVTSGGWYGWEMADLDLIGPGFSDINTCAVQLGGFSFAGQITEQSRFTRVNISEFTTVFRGDDTTGVKLLSCSFRRNFIAFEFNYNADLFHAEDCSFGDFHPNISSGLNISSGTVNVTLSSGLNIISTADCPAGGMIVSSRASAGSGVNLLPPDTRIATYNRVTGAATLSALPLGSDANASMQFCFQKSVVFRSATKIGSATFNTGSGVVSSNAVTNWTTGLVVGQYVRCSVGTNLQVFPLTAKILSIDSGQQITVNTNALASAAGNGTIYVRDLYGIWEGPSANPGGGVADTVEFTGNWFMRTEGAIYAGDGGGISIHDNYFEKAYSYGRIGWAGKTDLPYSISFCKNKLSIMGALSDAPFQILNKNNGTDAQTTVVIEGNYLDAPRGAPYGATGVVVPFIYYPNPALGGNNPSSTGAVLRGSFEYRNNFFPRADATQTIVDLGTNFGAYPCPVDGYEIIVKGVSNGNMLLPLTTGSLGTWYAYACDGVYVRSPTAVCTIPNWNGSFPFPGRMFTVMIEQGATPQDVVFGNRFKTAAGADLGTVTGAAANQRTALKFVSSGNNTYTLQGTVIWYSAG